MIALLHRLALHISIVSILLQPGLSLTLPSEIFNISNAFAGGALTNGRNVSTLTLGDFTPPHCVTHPDWMPDGLIKDDCFRLVNGFAASVKPHKEVPYEFVGQGLTPEAEFSLRTPFKKTYNTCTLAVVMMIQDIDLPDRSPQAYYSRDFARLGDLAVAAKQILRFCVAQTASEAAAKAGWKNVGYTESIAVILWTTGSVEDRRVPRHPPDGSTQSTE